MNDDVDNDSGVDKYKLCTEYHIKVRAGKDYMTWNINMYLRRMSLFLLSQTMDKNGQSMGVNCVNIIPSATRS
jgi:hypothetical protein